jgi:methylated-DNA-[protein]-cysteine S-methyltransferase
MSDGLALFDTAIGRCGIAWGAHGIRAVSLPEPGDDALRARLRRRAPDAAEVPPPPSVAAVVADVVALLRGEGRVFAAGLLDWRGVPDFHRRVYEVALEIPPGRTLTYGEVATRLGDRRQAQAVGQALGRNPFAPLVPCHRVVAADGRTGGFSAVGGVATKLRLLALEDPDPWGGLPLGGAAEAPR